MNDTHKLLLAMCEALDLDVEEIRTPKGRDFGSFGGSPAHVPVMKCSGGLWRQFDVDYKVTKKEPEYILHKFVIDEPVKTHIISFECDISSNNDTRK